MSKSDNFNFGVNAREGESLDSMIKRFERKTYKSVKKDCHVGLLSVINANNEFISKKEEERQRARKAKANLMKEKRKYQKTSHGKTNFVSKNNKNGISL